MRNFGMAAEREVHIICAGTPRCSRYSQMIHFAHENEETKPQEEIKACEEINPGQESNPPQQAGPQETSQEAGSKKKSGSRCA